MDLSAKHVPTIRNDLFGGKGAVKLWSLLRSSAEPFTAVLACVLDPGGHVGGHSQRSFPEIVIGLAGTGVVTINGIKQPLGTGDCVYLPLGGVMEIKNYSDSEGLHYLIIKARNSESFAPSKA
ncbi:MAG TPA: hypothetical protein ENK31_04305 [Nannocystis exedens]|nr:hypothetical protein [Nannocystis exedens]